MESKHTRRGNKRTNRRVYSKKKGKREEGPGPEDKKLIPPIIGARHSDFSVLARQTGPLNQRSRRNIVRKPFNTTRTRMPIPRIRSG